MLGATQYFLLRTGFTMVPVVLGQLLIAGCADDSGHGALEGNTLSETQLSIETVSEFHMRLNECASAHFLDAHYEGPLAAAGRSLGLRGSTGMLSWSMLGVTYGSHDELHDVLFTVSLVPWDGAAAVAVTEVSGKPLGIGAVVHGEGSLDIPQTYLSGMSIRSFLQQLEQPASPDTGHE